jgi:hypothetical protein
MNNYISKLNIAAAEYFTVAGMARHVCVYCSASGSASGFYKPDRVIVSATGDRCRGNYTLSYDLPATPSGNCEYAFCQNVSGVVIGRIGAYSCSSQPPVFGTPIPPRVTPQAASPFRMM